MIFFSTLLLKRLHNPVKDAFAAADSYAVIDNRHSRCCCKFKAAQKFPAVEHTPPAVEYEFVLRQIGGEIVSGADGELKFATCFFSSIRGILTLPISSSLAWWVHPSAIRTRLPGFSFFTASAPLRNVSRSPLIRARRIEKVVQGISAGVS